MPIEDAPSAIRCNNAVESREEKRTQVSVRRVESLIFHFSFVEI